jgi:hypothetical protein
VRIRLFLTTAAIIAAMAVLSSQSDLDSLMSEVLERRDDNWKKLQQYTLEEESSFRLMGPMDTPLYGSQREYMWFPREGFFIRSPRKADGVEIGESERRRQEDEWLKSQRAREAARAKRKGEAPGVESTTGGATDIPDVIRQTMEPEFVQAAYFLEFKFEGGHYGLVGRERLLDRDVLRVEYYPEQLFRDDDPDDSDTDEEAKKRKEARERRREKQSQKTKEMADRINRQMNKVSLVTLWVEPVERQILKYEFDNIDTDFLPGRSMLRIDEIKASMQMQNAFPGVWLPASVGMRFQVSLAIGRISARYDVAYRNYQLAKVDIRVVP